MIQFLNAATGTASTAEMLLSFLPMILIIVFMIILIYLPQKRQDKKDAAMRSSIEIGDKVTTIGGIVCIVLTVQGGVLLWLKICANQKSALKIRPRRCCCCPLAAVWACAYCCWHWRRFC